MDNGFSKDSLATYAAGQRERFERTLAELVEIPTVSVEPERKPDMRRGADSAVRLLESMGAKAKLYETPGHPIVYGRFDRGAGLPTVTVYNHLDVQPAEGPDWRTSPFEFVKQGDRYFGRGTTDDKGPAITALFGAKYAFDNGVAANIHFLWEFEEEIGSPHFETTIIDRAGVRSAFTPAATIRSASMSSPESVSSRMARTGSSTAIWKISLRFFSPPENPSFTERRTSSSSISTSLAFSFVIARKSMASSSGNPRCLRTAFKAFFKK